MMKKFFIFLTFLLFAFAFFAPPSAKANHCDPATATCSCQALGKYYSEGETTDGGCSNRNPGFREVIRCNSDGSWTPLTGGGEGSVTCTPTETSETTSDVKKVFGTVKPPEPIQQFINQGGEGAGGISLFVNNLLVLLYVIAGLIFVFMIIFGAIQWIFSGGNKDSVANARNRIIHAIIGIVILSAAIAIIRLVGTFTGFSFFNQKNFYYWDPNAAGGNGGCIRRFSVTGSDKFITEPAPAEKCPTRGSV